MVMKQSS